MHFIRNAPLLVVTVWLLGLTHAETRAADSCCTRCGGHSGVQRVCRPILTTKRVEVTCWDGVREEFCLPQKDTCGEPYGLVPGVLHPTRGQIHSRNKLMRKTVIEEVPVVRWVVEYVCVGCRSAATTATTPPLGTTPPVGNTPPADQRREPTPAPPRELPRKPQPAPPAEPLPTPREEPLPPAIAPPPLTPLPVPPTDEVSGVRSVDGKVRPAGLTQRRPSSLDGVIDRLEGFFR